MEKENKASFKKRLLTGFLIYGAVIVLIVVVLLVLSQRSGSESEENFTRLDSATSTDAKPSVLIPSWSPTLGPSNASITIIEFGDFQCPYCKASFSIIRRVLNEYPDDVRLIYRHLPLTNVHPLAMDLAHASMCAHEQGKFWAFHDRLFQFQDSVSANNIEEQAVAAGLNIERFRKCEAERRFELQVQQDFADAVAVGGRGTPTWLVNGQLVEGSLPFNVWQDIIDSLLNNV